jgi:NUMOD4 motif/HNH endonuclease
MFHSTCLTCAGPEHWWPYPGWETLYEVSDHGRVRSLDRIITTSHGVTRRHRGLVLTPHVADKGHLFLTLKSGERQLRRFVHVLVLSTFHGPCPPGNQSCHWDGNPAHNCVTNLRWDTQSANMLDMVRHGTQWQMAKTACPLDHLLVAPNLVLSKLPSRNCLACARGRSNHRHALKQGRPSDFRACADAHYRAIMEELGADVG